MKPGDTLTIAGVHPAIRRRWWQFWKPRIRPDKSRLQIFRITEATISLNNSLEPRP